MAPKGGRGGGGGGGKGGGVNVDCNSNAFKTPHAKAIIAFAALFAVVYLVLACMVPLKKRRVALNLERPGKKNRSWSFLRVGIYFQILATIVFITTFATRQCGSAAGAQFGLQTARAWLEAVAILTLYGIILIGLCKRMHEVSGSVLPKLVTIAHSVYFGLLVLIDLVALAISSALANMDGDASVDTRRALADASKGIIATFDVFAFIGMGIAAASMLLALVRSSQLKEGMLKVWVLLLIISSIGITLLELAYYANFTLQKNALTPEADVAYYVLRCLFYAVMFTSLLFIYKNQYIATGGAQSGVPATAPPQQAYNPNMTEGYKPEDNNGYAYGPQYAPSPSPVHPSPHQNNAAYPAPYSPTNNVGQYPQNNVSPPPPEPYHNNPATGAPYNGNNVNYTPVASPPPPQPYYH